VVPASENAVSYLMAATAAMTSVEPPSYSNLSFTEYPPYPAEWYRLADSAVASNAKALTLARQMRAHDRIDWGPMPASPLAAHLTGFPYESERALGYLLSDAALQAHMHNDDAEAIARIEDMAYEARVISDGKGDITGWLVALGIDERAICSVSIMSSDLQIGERPGGAQSSATRGSTRRAARRIVEDLIRRLVDVDAARDVARRAFFAQRCWMLDAARFPDDDPILLKPARAAYAAAVLDRMDVYIEALREPSMAAAFKFVDSNPGPSGGAAKWVSSRTGGLWASVYRDVMTRALEDQARLLADRRVAAIMLAVRLYRIDQGAWPHDLNILVPRYLPAVPADPDDAKQRPISYVIVKQGLPDGRDRPMLFFNGPASGPAPAPPNRPTYYWYDDGAQWRDLARWSPRPTTDAAK
jgi:hypothetical protein